MTADLRNATFFCALQIVAVVFDAPNIVLNFVTGGVFFCLGRDSRNWGRS